MKTIDNKKPEIKDCLPREEWKECPNSHCHNNGFYPIEPDGDADQCEFCWTNKKSVFYQQNMLWGEIK